MADSKNAKIGKSYISPTLNDKLYVNMLRMGSKGIGTWKNAIDIARNPIQPNRRYLIELFEDIKIDAHLEAVMEKRSIAITNKKVLFHPNNEGGTISESVQANILETPWFNELLKYGTEQIPFGFSVVELIPVGGVIQKVALIPRQNVIPERSFIMLNAGNIMDGIYYDGDNASPEYSPYLLNFGGKKDYGKLMTVAQYVIYKRGGFGDWSQFAELFGMPFRVGKYDPYDDVSRQKLYSALDQMGGAGFAVIPNGASLEFIQNAQAGQSDIYKNLVNICDEQISKSFLGNTMTTDSGSSHSQSETHKDSEEELNVSDMLKLEYQLNWDFKSKMVNLGAKELSQGKIQFEKTQEIPLDKQIEIDMQVAEQVPIAEEYWYSKYGVAKPDGKAKPINADPANPKGQKKKLQLKSKSLILLNSSIADLYSHVCDHPEHNLSIVTLASKQEAIDPIWNRIVKGIHSGEIKPGSVDPELFKWTAQQLFKGVTKGFGGDFDAFYHDDPDSNMLAHLETNVHVFSAFKTYQTLRQATDQLTDKDGNVKSFAQFRNDVSAINDQFNVNWLNTEYNQAIASSQMASLWVDIESNADALPLLKYHTAGDGRVRPAHALLAGIIKPVNDEFWNSYYPPNDWGCRCDVIQLAEGDVTSMKGRKLPTLKPMFDSNTAKQGVVFPEKHPYYKVAKEDKEAAKNNFGMDIPDKNKK